VSAPLEATGLGRRYGKTWALRDCSLRVSEGAIVALVGPNGAGKSTLMQLAVGLIEPSAGTVRVYGQGPGSSPQALARVAFLAQDHPLYGTFTVGELLHLGQAMNPRWDAGLARRHLDALDIPLRRRASRLSGGQQSQVALTLALGKRPDLLVLDEPVASLDPLARRDFMARLLTDAADRGTTVVLSSHVVSELERVCDHLIVLAGSRLQLDGPIDWLLQNHRTLVGPRLPHGRTPVGVRQVIARTDTDRQTTLIAQIDSEPGDPAWRTHPLTLEELVLSYLREPAAGLRPGLVSAPAVRSAS